MMELLPNPGLQQGHLRCLCHTSKALCTAVMECSGVVALWLKTHMLASAGMKLPQTIWPSPSQFKDTVKHTLAFIAWWGRNTTHCQWLRKLHRVKITVWGYTTVRLTVEPKHTIWAFVLTSEHGGLLLHQWLFIDCAQGLCCLSTVFSKLQFLFNR